MRCSNALRIAIWASVTRSASIMAMQPKTPARASDRSWASSFESARMKKPRLGMISMSPIADSALQASRMGPRLTPRRCDRPFSFTRSFGFNSPSMIIRSISAWTTFASERVRRKSIAERLGGWFKASDIQEPS